MKLLFTGDINFRGVEALDYNKALEIIPYKFDITSTKITVFDGDNKEKMNNYINNLSE